MATPADFKARVLILCAGVCALPDSANAQPAAPRYVEALTASDGQAGDSFGVAIACEGDVLVIGADRDDDACPGFPSTCNSGAAYVFERVGGRWMEVAKLRAPVGAAGDRFGAAVAVSGGVIVVSCYGDDAISVNSGAVYVYERIAGVWTQTAKLKASDPWPSDTFGAAVAIDGGVIAIGATLDDDGADNAGSIYIFEKNPAGAWTQRAKLTASDGARSDNLGGALAMHNGLLVAGVPNDEPKGLPEAANRGSVCVFARNPDGSWIQVTKLITPDAVDLDRLGRAVSVHNGVVAASVLAGEAGCAGCPIDTGSVHTWRLSGGGFVYEGELVGPDSARDDQFGASLLLTPGELLVGAPGHDFGASGAGAAYIFKRVGDAGWGAPVKLVRPGARAADMLGAAGARRGGELLLGVTGDDLRGAAAGAVDVMSTETCAFDLDGDGQVGASDVQALIARWGQKGAPGDLNDDGVVNSQDIAILLGAFGPCP